MTSPRDPVVQLSAYEDIADIADRTRRFAGQGAADKVTEQILQKIERLGGMPYLGSLHHDPFLARSGYRKLVVGKYVVVYRVEEERAIVLRAFRGLSDYAGRIEG